MLDVSIVIITDKYKEYLKRCLDSLLNNKPVSLLEVIVVNKIGSDKTEEMLKERYGFAKNINLTMPFSMSIYRNVGIKNANGKYILLADADILFLRDTIDKYVDFMDKNRDVGLAGGKLIGFDGKLQYSCRTFYTWLVIFSRRFLKNQEIENWHLMKNWDHDSAREVDWVGGGFSCIRREAFLDIGLLDERFTYGFEDVDYSLRMWKKGWKVMYANDAIAKHFGFRQSTGFNLWALRHYKSAAVFFLKHKGWGKR